MKANTPLTDLSNLAVLVSGGLDSAILLAEACRQCPTVHPVYIRFGLNWEDVELAYLHRYLDAIRTSSLQSLVLLEMPVQDLYGQHWSVTGRDVPGARTPDEAVYLPGRNVLLLAKGILWCHLHQVAALAMAPLGSNPFPDATPAFFHDFPGIVNRAIEGGVRVVLPYADLHKVDVLRRGQGLPLEWTFSCIRPVAGQHCGVCNKCAERQLGFAQAGQADPTSYQRR